VGNNSQRKKERHAKRRKEKQKKQVQQKERTKEITQHGVAVTGTNAPHRQRLARQNPVAWPDELPEDAAIFDESALHSLPPERVSQVQVVQEALQEALESRGENALKSISVIPRSSPLSEWRLFIRGLVDWLADLPESATESWKRLDSTRRPGRIATVMMASRHLDLEQRSPSTADTSSNVEDEASVLTRMDAQQLYHAKLLRRVRFDRHALKIAESGMNAPEEIPDVDLGPAKISWLERFIAEYRDTEPELSEALAQTALAHAFDQQYTDLFESAIAKFEGPRHDRRNRLLTYFYYSQFDSLASESLANKALDRYLDHDLPNNEALSPSLRGAIASQVHLNVATSLIAYSKGPGFLGHLVNSTLNDSLIRKHLQAASKAAPSNGEVYEEYIDWIETKLDYPRISKSEHEQFENELAKVMASWSAGQPEKVEPRLWLVTQYLENEQLQEAQPHIEFLAASRQDDPRVRAMPWKWQLMEAMRLCRRKAWLAEVPPHLNEVEKLWPTWLPKAWFLYLEAAFTLRSGKKELFETQRQQICEQLGRDRDSLADACMMLAAAQKMRATPTELKTLRAAADLALKKVKSAALDQILEVAGFFWDLHRIQMTYPGYRSHSKTIGDELFGRLKKSPKLVVDRIDDELLQKSVLWGSEHRFWSSYSGSRFPAFFEKQAVQKHPLFVAAKANAIIKDPYMTYYERNPSELVRILRDAASSQRDAYNQHWLTHMSNQLEDVVNDQSFPLF